VSITPQALTMLSEHAWPGNVRELRNAVERAAVLSGAKPLDSGDFSLVQGRNGAGGHATLPLNGSFDLRAQVEVVEKALILRALEASKGNRREAAGLLGISLRTLFYKLRRVQATA
jgi:DNA-binding NtrC family response regulator